MNENGREQAGMGVAVGDYNNDGLVDFYITNFSDDSNTLYRDDGDSNLRTLLTRPDWANRLSHFWVLERPLSISIMTAGKTFLFANGHVYPQVGNFQWGTSYAQQRTLFRNMRPDAKTSQIVFERVAASPKSSLALALTARGLAISDLDGDGKMDVSG